MRKIVIGMTAHVDAGKTTCLEAMLYKAGRIRKLGRVDNGTATMDYDTQEREHGITIYTKDAWLDWQDTRIYVIDTPGHVDFSAAMERCLSVLDMAVLVINGREGVQAHTLTIWKCLEHYKVPTIVFVNKMDIALTDKQEIVDSLRKQCSGDIMDFTKENIAEDLAMVSEQAMNFYLHTNQTDWDEVRKAFAQRKFFPVLFGSGLRNEGIDTLLDTIVQLQLDQEYPSEFGARVYQISNDENGERLTHVKITGGTLNARQKLNEEDKVDQIRFYTGKNYELAQEAAAGDICTLKGPEHIEAGMGLGFEKDNQEPMLNAYLRYQLIVPDGTNMLLLNEICQKLQQEDPQLDIAFDSNKNTIEVRLMGEMQMEVLAHRIAERSGIQVSFGTGRIVYQETIRNSVIGVGHFEPLRHYAEVVVRLDPLPRGSGVKVSSEIVPGSLSNLWEKTILSALQRQVRGVLTGSSLTDVQIVLIAGRGNLKHTSGGDFRQAARRAVRQGLMKAENTLLEPYYNFTAHVPSVSLSHVLLDLEQKDAQVEISGNENGEQIITGTGPVRTMQNYQRELSALTKGKGRVFCTLAGYQSVKKPEEIISAIGYNPDNDLAFPTGSVFCANGAGYYVPWTDVEKHMHIDLKSAPKTSTQENKAVRITEENLLDLVTSAASNNRSKDKKSVHKPEEKVHVKASKQLPPRMIVDGYNCIFSWESLAEYRKESLSLAREKLMDQLFLYQPYVHMPILVVFDGYKKAENAGTSYKREGLEVVYTSTGLTADAYIEKKAADWQARWHLIVVTSDALIQNAVLAHGAQRMSARELEQDLLLRLHH